MATTPYEMESNASDSHVTITEVGPRDGLQAEAAVLPAARRGTLVAELLLAAHLPVVEAASFVSATRVPQMADAEAVVAIALSAAGDTNRLTALVPNLVGFRRALAVGMTHVRCVVAASDTMNRVNFGTGTAGTLDGIRAVAASAASAGVRFGIVIATAWGCPFEGSVDPRSVVALAETGAELGATEIVLADTTGVAFPTAVARLCRDLLERGAPALGCHFHNTRNTGYANVYAALTVGVRRLDSSIGGAGGCPFAPGATGNVATEDVVHLVHGLGLETGVDLDALLRVANQLEVELGHPLPGLVHVAGPATRSRVVAA